MIIVKDKNNGKKYEEVARTLCKRFGGDENYVYVKSEPQKIELTENDVFAELEPADGGVIGCLLHHERNIKYENIKTPKGSGHITVYSPKECCHKPKTLKEFAKRLKELY